MGITNSRRGGGAMCRIDPHMAPTALGLKCNTVNEVVLSSAIRNVRVPFDVWVRCAIDTGTGARRARHRGAPASNAHTALITPAIQLVERAFRAFAIPPAT